MRAVLLCCLFAVACAPAPSAVRRVPDGPLPEVTEDTVTYDIEGSTSKELRASLDQKGQLDDTGRHDAYTKWFVRWFYDYDRAEAVCRLTNVRSTVEVKYTLPRWPGENAEVGPRWQEYLKALMAHERGHTQTAVEAARFIVAGISALPPAADCDAAGAEANALGNHELDLAHQRDRQYDAETKHGETQGATFR